MQKSVATWGVLAGFTTLTGLGAAFVACGSSNSASSGPSTTTDAAAPDDTGAPDAGADSTLPAYLDAGIFADPLAATVPGAPLSMAYNPTNHQVYAGLISISDSGIITQAGAGIAILDAVTKQLTTVLDEPDGGEQGLQSIVALAVDPVANKVYATDATNIYVIDGTSEAITLTIASPNAAALVVDSATHVLYALQLVNVTLDSGVFAGVERGTLVAYDATGTVTHTVALPDLNFATPPPPYALAFEPSSHHLYVCGSSAEADAALAPAVDTFDVANGLTEAPQQTFSGKVFGCLAGFGGGALVTNAPSAAIYFFDPTSAPVTIPGSFSPLVMAVNAVGTPASIFFGGEDTESNGLVMNVAIDGTITVPPALAGSLPQPSDFEALVVGQPLAGNAEEVFVAIEPGSQGVAIAGNQIVYSPIQIR